jgi:formylglycine-generating enzyme required for sulfatase activity/uncharacterized caspase-like protein
LVLLPSLAQAEKRVALLIGNQSYTSEIGRLANPHNDIALLELALKGLGFEVAVERDASLGALTRAINAYARRVRMAGPNAVGFFYYSGHGAADAGINYLIPVDVKSAEDSELWDQSLRLTEVTRKLKNEAGNATHFVVFDACRNNLKLKTAGSRALVQSKGFVPVTQETGMLIAFATAEGELASDVGAGAGPYAKVLAEEIVKPGLEAVHMFRRVQVRVRSAIGQEPWLGFSALGEVHFAGRETPVTTAPQAPVAPARLSEAAEAWDRTKDTASITVLEAFIARYKDTFYAELARAQLDKLKEKQVAVAVPPKASAPAQPKPVQPAEAVPPISHLGRCDDGVAEWFAGSPPIRRCLKPKDTFKDCPECPEMVLVPAGEFMMGSPPNEEGRQKDEGPQRIVVIAKALAVGRFEVTFAEWDTCVAASGCKHKPGDEGWGRGKRPAINVSWEDAKEYVTWLTRKSGRAYRLLSETEWEYAARAGTTTAFSTGQTITTDQANFDHTYGKSLTGSFTGVYRQKTIEVGSLNTPNAFGLHDMHGNVSEWVEDCYQNASCSSRVVRGGSWNNHPVVLRSASRIGVDPGLRHFGRGFRVARTLD